ncbi:endonuclease III [soil metagenome]
MAAPKKQINSGPIWDQVDERSKKEIALRKPKKSEFNRAGKIADILEANFPEADCALNHANPFQLLVATILSAQCTDARVNMVTPALFKKYKTPSMFAAAPEGELENDIRSTGFFNSKAKALREASKGIIERFGGKVPVSIPEIQTLRGAARKTANVVRMHAFKLPGMAVDTHFSRISQRLELTESTDPEKIEFDVEALLPPERWTRFADAMILHGRKTCHARNPQCEVCPIFDLCPSGRIFLAERAQKKAPRR